MFKTFFDIQEIWIHIPNKINVLLNMWLVEYFKYLIGVYVIK